MSEDRLMNIWKKRDPYLSDFEGYEKFVEQYLERQERFQKLKAELTTWKTSEEYRAVPKETRKYRAISAVFASRDKKSIEPRFHGLFFIGLGNRELHDFDEEKVGWESKGDKFICFQVMHEETLDHDPERPHLKGTFAIYDYYDYEWNLIPKPEALKKIEKHLKKVSDWYDRGQLRGEPYPTPPEI